MKTKRYLFRSLVLAAALTLGSGQIAAARCSPAVYAYCWEQYEMCIVNGGDESQCVSEYFDCLTRRGCG